MNGRTVEICRLLIIVSRTPPCHHESSLYLQLPISRLNFNDIEIRIFIRRLIEIISMDVKQGRSYKKN